MARQAIVLPSGEKVGRGVPGGVVRRQVLRRGRAVDRGAPDVEIGAPGLGLAGEAGREQHRRPVGREGVVLVAAERLGRGVAVEALHQRPRGAARHARGVEVEREQVVVGPVRPGVPVADEQPVEDLAGRGLALGLRVQPLLGALQRRAVGEDRGRDTIFVPSGLSLEGADVERKVGHLGGGGAGGIGAPDLVGARAARGEVDRLAVGRPARAGRAAGRGGQPLRRGVLGLQVDDPRARGRTCCSGSRRCAGRRRPSGRPARSLGSLTRSMVARSCGVNGRASAAPARAARPNTAAAPIERIRLAFAIRTSSNGYRAPRCSRPPEARSQGQGRTESDPGNDPAN